MKSHFQSGEDLKLAFDIFIDRTTGLEVSGDSVTIVVTAPDGSHPSGPSATQDSTTGVWKATIDTDDYQEGRWYFKATSSAANTNGQRLVLDWGGYVDYLNASIADVPTAADNADAVWDEALSGHTTAGTAGKKLGDVPLAADNADAVWDEATSGHTTAGTTGKALADTRDKTDNLPSDPADQSLVEAAIAAARVSIKGGDDRSNTDVYQLVDDSVAGILGAIADVQDDATDLVDALKGPWDIDNDGVFTIRRPNNSIIVQFQLKRPNDANFSPPAASAAKREVL